MKGEFAVGWFTLSLINAGLAQTKGRKWLGVVVWILVLRADLYAAYSCIGSQRTRRQRTVEVIP